MWKVRASHKPSSRAEYSTLRFQSKLTLGYNKCIVIIILHHFPMMVAITKMHYY